MGVRSGGRYGPACLQPPIPIPAREGLKEASEISLPSRGDGQSEDCLYLNVWSGAPDRFARLPVMVYVHGGGFQTGSGDTPMQDPSRLAAQGMVVVTLNYRLGAFGFLAHPDLAKESGAGSGDYGALDQVAALQWIHDNISNFGGDPEQVTVFGGSAGAISVSLLTASPLAKGLFQRAISESGSAFGPRAVQPAATAEAVGLKVFKEIGAKSLAEARAGPAVQILQAQVRSGFAGRPTIGGAFMPKSPAAIYAAGQQNDVAIMAGWNADEYTLLSPKPPGSGSATTFKAYLARRFGANAGVMQAAYPVKPEDDAVRAAGRLFGDEAIGAGVVRWTQLNAWNGKKPGYLYYFNHAAPVPADTAMFGRTGEELGAAHGGEMYYVYDALGDLAWPWTDRDRALAKTMQGYWVNFAKTGDPNGPGLPRWSPVGPKGAVRLMTFGDTTRMTIVPRGLAIDVLNKPSNRR
jgi:para-nitrobenzyl esterase